MPTYEYCCENCGQFEKFQKITASPLTKCPTCGGEVRKVFTAPGIIFKGSGFYVNDSRNNDTKKESNNSASQSSEKVS